MGNKVLGNIKEVGSMDEIPNENEELLQQVALFW